MKNIFGENNNLIESFAADKTDLIRNLKATNARLYEAANLLAQIKKNIYLFLNHIYIKRNKNERKIILFRKFSN